MFFFTKVSQQRSDKKNKGNESQRRAKMTVDENEYCPECLNIVTYTDDGKHCVECDWSDYD